MKVIPETCCKNSIRYLCFYSVHIYLNQEYTIHY